MNDAISSSPVSKPEDNRNTYGFKVTETPEKSQGDLSEFFQSSKLTKLITGIATALAIAGISKDGVVNEAKADGAVLDTTEAIERVKANFARKRQEELAPLRDKKEEYIKQREQIKHERDQLEEELRINNEKRRRTQELIAKKEREHAELIRQLCEEYAKLVKTGFYNQKAEEKCR